VYIQAIGNDEVLEFNHPSNNNHEVRAIGPGSTIKSSVPIYLGIKELIAANVTIQLAAGSILFLNDNLEVGPGLVIEVQDGGRIIGRPKLPADAKVTPDWR